MDDGVPELRRLQGWGESECRIRPGDHRQEMNPEGGAGA